jgi:DNA polymerase III gamma/tau subunit
MQVRLDSGRTIAFELKDYGHLDHGYAATIHKAQGVTVDRVHVLATPGLDRHAAYVALSRHRETVALHYGRDDFTDNAKLTRTLSRDRSKDMASDYVRKEQAVQKAPQRTPEPGPRKERSIFSSFRPSTVSRESAITIGAPQGTDNDLHRAVRRYARSALDIAKMQELKLPVLPHQVQAHERAQSALDAITPHSSQDLANALARDPALTGEAAVGRTRAAIRAMQIEAEIRTNPERRADRFVAGWQNLERQRRSFERNEDWQNEHEVRNSMGDMAKSLHRDPQLESILRNRSHDLGISADMGRGIQHSLLDYVGFGRSRGLSI